MATTTEVHNAGDYSLSIAEIISYKIQGGPPGSHTPYIMDIRNIIMGVTLSESIYDFTMVGKIQVYDTQDIRTLLPITGLERLNLKFNTPGVPGINGVANKGHPFHIYKIESIFQDKSATSAQAYDIYFCSRETYYNNMRKVSKAYEGAVELGVEDIFRGKKYLNSRKQLFMEPTKYKTKVVIPNLKPFNAIDLLGSRAVSGKYENAGYLFFETPDGYHFRSYESMFAVDGVVARPSKFRYMPQRQNVRGPHSTPTPEKDMHGVHNWGLTDSVNILKNLSAGAYANKSIEYDPFYKTININEYDYDKNFGKHFHTEHSDGWKTDVKTPLPYAKFDDTNKAVSEEFDQRVVLSPNTSNVHDNFKFIGPKLRVQHMMSQRQLLKHGVLTLNVWGNSLLRAGDIINFEMPLLRPMEQNTPVLKNPHWGGRYLVTAIKHNIVRGPAGRYTMVISAVKDNVAHPYKSEFDSWTHVESPKSKSHNIYELDKALLGRIKSLGTLDGQKLPKTGPHR